MKSLSITHSSFSNNVPFPACKSVGRVLVHNILVDPY